jgi:acetyltransferase EpsM
MKSIVIFGSKDHSKVVFSEIIQLKKFKILGFIDNFSKKGKIIISHNNKKYKVLGNIESIKKLKKITGVIAIGDNYIRKKVSAEINSTIKKFKWETIISKNAIINKNVKIGEGTLILSNSIINTGTKIGKHCLIGMSSSIDHDNDFKNFSSAGPRVTTGGNVKVGEMSHLGISATIKNKIIIGKNTIIGGKSFINKNCINNCIYYGIPGKKIRKRNSDDKYL